MPRRKKNMTYAEEMAFLDNEIAKTEEVLKQLKTRRKELEKVKEQEDIIALYDAIKGSGKTVEEVISTL